MRAVQGLWVQSRRRRPWPWPSVVSCHLQRPAGDFPLHGSCLGASQSKGPMLLCTGQQRSPAGPEQWKHQFTEISKSPAPTPTPPTQLICTRTVCSCPGVCFSTQYRVCPERLSANRFQLDGLLRLLRQESRNSGVLFPQPLKFTAVRPVSSKVSPGRAAGGGPQSSPWLILHLWPFPLSPSLIGAPSKIFRRIQGA